MSEELTAREELEQIALMLKEADESEKEWKSHKEDLRGPFFELITEVVREEIPLARKTVEIGPTEDAEQWRAFNEPLMRIVAIEAVVEDGKQTAQKVVLEENEALTKFEFTVGGHRFGRQIRMEGKSFLAEKLYEDLTEEKWLEWYLGDEEPSELVDLLLGVISKKEIVVYEVDEDAAIALMSERPETVAIFQKYMFPGEPRAALMPIKQVKESEE